jgi:hypothetical protein
LDGASRHNAAVARTSQHTAAIVDRSRISGFSHYIWDATFFAAKAIATSYHECSRRDATHRLDIACVLPRLRATQINGTTGWVQLDAVGDRYGMLRIINVVNGERVGVGQVEVLNASSTIDIDIPAIIWSDGVSGLISGPTHGQEAIPPTSAPVANLVPDVQSIDATATVVISVLVGVLAAGTIAIIGHRANARRCKLRPADFRKVGHGLSNFRNP